MIQIFTFPSLHPGSIIGLFLLIVKQGTKGPGGLLGKERWQINRALEERTFIILKVE
jgi:hypothetical protein